MSVYVGLDVHRKRSQVGVIDQDGEVLANRNVPNGVEPILRVTSGLPCGTHGVRGRLGLGVAGAGCWMTTGSTRTWVHPLQCKAIGAAAEAALRPDPRAPDRRWLP